MNLFVKQTFSPVYSNRQRNQFLGIVVRTFLYLLRSIRRRVCCYTIQLSAYLVLIIMINGCKKYVEIPPPAAAVDENSAYTMDASAIGVVTGIYTSMNSTGPFTGNSSISLYAGLSADELTLYSAATGALPFYYRNALGVVPPTSTYGSELWGPLFNFVFKCNAAITGLTSSKADALNYTVKLQLLGEAKFMRAFFYFYLVNLFGDVPLTLTTDYKTNTLLSRSSKSDVYRQIILDLKEAQDLLSGDYLKETLLSTTNERVRPTKWAAQALLARVYLYIGDWVNAEDISNKLIDNTSFSLSTLNRAFLKSSLGNNEAIWQLQPTAVNFNTQEARTFIIPTTGLSGSNPVYLSNSLLSSFEPGDQRAISKNWVDSIKVIGTTYRYPYKYKLNTSDPTINASSGTTNIKEYLMIFRLGEQFLIRAEARAQQNNISGALNDLNKIRVRAGLKDTTVIDKENLLGLILHERQVELFAEFGHRWFDLKRMSKIDEVMQSVTPMKANGVSWKSYQQWYPLPQTDLNRGPNLQQNFGY